MKESFVAINIITDKNQLLNVGDFPIIFYWDGESDILNDMKNNEVFRNIIFTECLKDINSYTSSRIALLYLNNVKETSYEAKHIEIQNLYTLSNIASFKSVWDNYVFGILRELYKEVYKKEFIVETQDNAFETKLLLIPYLYKEIRACTNKELSNNTITNYILMKLTEDKILSKENINYIINYLKENIKEP